MEDLQKRQNEVIGQFNKLRLDLGALAYGDMQSKIQQELLGKKLKALEDEFAKNAAEIEKLKASGVQPIPEAPGVELTEDAKRELIENMKVTQAQPIEADNEAPAQTAGDAPASQP